MKYTKAVKIWLISGCVLLIFQVIIGGITRITGSGLSITKWEIVTGTLPPTNNTQWESEFELYKQTPQYEKINKGFSLEEFKFIYFWEYFHRLWARMMGLIFLFPFIYFLLTKKIDRRIIKNLGFVIFFAFLAAIFGWIMVASGLVERPWVNAYKLTLHLSIALTTLGFMYWTTFIAFNPEKKKYKPSYTRLKGLSIYVTILICLQIFLGGIMSGLRAGLIFPTWPDMHGSFLPEQIFDSNNWNLESFKTYDRSAFVPALFHTLHRNLAYLILFVAIFFYYKIRKSILNTDILFAANIFLGLLLLQVLFGILTVINCIGRIPLFYGVGHQAIAILLLGATLYLNFTFSNTYSKD